MYIESTNRYYNRSGEQHTTAKRFLILLQPDKPTIGESVAATNTYAIVRKVALRQLGHFMMGRANINGKWRSVSGAYGSDGLPMSVDKLPSDAVPLPVALYEAWNKGRGWNGAGSEATSMREWAIATFPPR